MRGRRGIYERRQRQRPLYPLFVVSAEGNTEEKSIREALKPYKIVLKFAPQATLGREQIEIVTSTVKKLARRASAKQTIVPIVVCDIETLDSATIALAKDVVAYGKRQGVLVCINVPHFERRMLLHFCPIPEALPKNQIEEMLSRELQKAGFPDYMKPGSDAYHRRLAALTPKSIEHCSASGHSSIQLPCLCDLFSLAAQHQSTYIEAN